MRSSTASVLRSAQRNSYFLHLFFFITVVPYYYSFSQLLFPTTYFEPNALYLLTSTQ